MRCNACGTDGQENSMGQFVSRDWLRCQNLQAKIDQLEAEKNSLTEKCAKVAREYLLRMGHTIMAGYVEEEIKKSV